MGKLIFYFLVITIYCGTFCLCHNNTVVIIGAGSAGIAAATRLLERNFNDFVILEAKTRIGGRIWSVPFGDAIIDLGAEWCHGEVGNLVFERVRDLNLLKKYNIKDGFFRMAYTKTKIDVKDFTTIYKIFESIYISQPSLHGDFPSLQDYFIKRYNESISNKFSDNATVLQFAIDSTYYFLRTICSYEGCYSPSEVSGYSTFKESAGDQNLHWNGKGYKTFLDVLMKKYPNPNESLPIDDKLLLDREVRSIKWKNENSVNEVTPPPDDNHVEVTCSNGEKYFAKHVIVTVSLGVLKENAVNWFDPPLPESKMKAIETIGFGAVMKLFLQYEKRWWANDNVDFIWSVEEQETLHRNNCSWIIDILMLIPYKENDKVLALWVTGPGVPLIETLSDEEVLTGVKMVFETFMKNEYDGSKPVKMLRTKWLSDPHFRGSYSYDSVKMNANNSFREDLSKPISHEGSDKPVLLFAGEATNPFHHSTVHGAAESGFREADRILSLYRQD